MWGRKGMTAISQVCEGMGAFGQGSITALTRRHGYVRGHDMGPSGLQPEKAGRRIWFCTRDNQVIERKVQVASDPGAGRCPARGTTRSSCLMPICRRESSRCAWRTRSKVMRKYFLGDLTHKPVLHGAARGLRRRGSFPGGRSRSGRGFRLAGHVAAAR